MKQSKFDEFLGDEPSIFDDGSIVISRKAFSKDEALSKFIEERIAMERNSVKKSETTLEDVCEGWVHFEPAPEPDYGEGEFYWRLYETKERPYDNAQPVWYANRKYI